MVNSIRIRSIPALQCVCHALSVAKSQDPLVLASRTSNLLDGLGIDVKKKEKQSTPVLTKQLGTLFPSHER